MGNCNRSGSENLRQHGAGKMERTWDMNFDVLSYQFSDLDLKIAAGRLAQRDQNILILHLMGHSQREIAGVSGVTRSMISRILQRIRDELATQLR